MMICYTIPNSNADFYFDPQKITKILFTPDSRTIRIKLIGDSEWEELIFTSDFEYNSFREHLMRKVV